MILTVLKKVLGQFRYLLIAITVTFSVLSVALLHSNFGLIQQVFSSDAINLFEKLFFFFILYGSLALNFSFFSGMILVLVAVTFGINISLLVYYVRKRQTKGGTKKASATSLGGIIAATLGIGCAACGSIILTAVLGLFGAGSFLLWLPLQGAEFSFIGLALLIFSTYYLIKKINDPLVCPA